MKFKELPGHKRVKDSLVRLADSGRIPHAIMLCGPTGIGKMLLARTFAQYVQCESPIDGEPCGACQSCRLHESFNHPGLHFTYPYVRNKSKKVDSAQDLAESWRRMLKESPSMSYERWLEIIDAGNSQPLIYVSDSENIIISETYASMNSRFKFFIIWLPEKLQQAAANKLLKVIEEPTDGTIFILVSNNESDILPTISSRTQRFNMYPLKEEEVAGYLENRYGLSRQKAFQFAHLANGSLAKADELGTKTGERTEFDALYQEIMRAAYAKKPALLLSISDKASAMGREKLKRFLEFMSRMTRENFIFNLRIPALNQLTNEEVEFSSKFAPFIHHGNVEEIVEQIEKSAIDISRNGNSKLILFSFFLYLIPLLHKKAT